MYACSLATPTLFYCLYFSFNAENDDFILPSSQSIIFPSSAVVNDEMCLQFQIIGDDLREDNETFTVLLESENQLDMIVGDITQIPVTILNDQDRESHTCIVNMLLITSYIYISTITLQIKYE